MDAPVHRVFEALVDREALETWLPPNGMTASFERFNPVRGGSYRLELTYTDPAGAPGKSSADSDVVEVHYLDIAPNVRVVQAVGFVADDPAFTGTMTMTWTVQAAGGGTLVEIVADNVPDGISASDHAAGMASSLNNLASFVETCGRSLGAKRGDSVAGMARSHPDGRHRHVLADGTRVIIRPIEAGDGEKLQAAFERLSPESRYRRFFTAMPRLSEAMLLHLLDVDGVDRVAWAALDADTDGEPGIGVARYFRIADQPDAAEMAVAVVDDYQHRGLGALLLRHLSRTAREQGIQHFVGTVLAQNRPMLDLIEGAGGRYTLDEPGVLRLEIEVPDVDSAEAGPRPGIFKLLRAAARWR